MVKSVTDSAIFSSFKTFCICDNKEAQSNRSLRGHCTQSLGFQKTLLADVLKLLQHLLTNYGDATDTTVVLRNTPCLAIQHQTEQAHVKRLIIPFDKNLFSTFQMLYCIPWRRTKK